MKPYLTFFLKPQFSKVGLSTSPWLTSAIFLLPVAVGLLGTWLPAFGWLPAIDARVFSIQAWPLMTDYPGFWTALKTTLTTGLVASFLAILITLLLLIGLYPSKLFKSIERNLAPLLSVPHAAFAIGLGLLIMPSGWLVRLLAQGFDQLASPPNIATFQDPMGLSLILALTLKEIPFLLFMSLAVLPSLKVSQTITLTHSLGHSRRYAWVWLIFPQLYKQIKLPFFAIIAYSLTVVDIAMIAGPTTPPTLAVMVNHWFYDPNLELRTLGAAGATSLLAINILVLGLLHLLEKPAALLRCHVVNQGSKKAHRIFCEKPIALVSALLLFSFYIGATLQMLSWSFASRWRYPHLWPDGFSTKAWSRIFNRIDEPFYTTFQLALASATLALVLCILMLENEVRLRHKKRSINTDNIQLLIYLPLLIPQIAFLFGFQVFLIQLGIDANFYALLWSHCIFVIPYVFLTLSGPYRRYDQRYQLQALSLSASHLKSFWLIKLPILLRPILYAFATGFSVSIAQYLPTLFIGAGKFSTLTTEAVAITSGSDRRLIAVMALWQQALPLLIFLLATLAPALLFRKRKALL